MTHQISNTSSQCPLSSGTGSPEEKGIRAKRAPFSFALMWELTSSLMRNVGNYPSTGSCIGKAPLLFQAGLLPLSAELVFGKRAIDTLPDFRAMFGGPGVPVDFNAVAVRVIEINRPTYAVVYRMNGHSIILEFLIDRDQGFPVRHLEGNVVQADILPPWSGGMAANLLKSQVVVRRPCGHEDKSIGDFLRNFHAEVFPVKRHRLVQVANFQMNMAYFHDILSIASGKPHRL